VIRQQRRSSAEVLRRTASSVDGYWLNIPAGGPSCPAAPEEVAAAVRAVRAGIPVLPASAQRGLLADAAAPRPAAGDPAVSPREVEVLRLLAEGLANPQIAQRLAISVPTVKTHVNNLFAKLAVPDRAAAVATAAARGPLG